MIRLFRRIFFPPPESSRVRRYLPWVMLFGAPLLILLTIPATWEYSNSPEFCGETCHTMPPEYQAYLVSPHARVPCVDCHIGRGSVYEKFIRKTGHASLLIDTVTGNFEYPIFVSEMRPARETCELCHFPEKFSDDSLRAIARFENDEENTAYTIYLLMHTGGGTVREGLGQGIHWHIENEVEFVALDRLEQEIPWVRVTYVDGTVETYATEDSPVNDGNLGEYTVREMDCITCHNRISHLLQQPRNAIDSALAQGDLSTDIPNIREQAIELLSEEYESVDEARDSLASLTTFYEENYPDFYADRADTVDSAVDVLVGIYEDNHYPEQELDPDTHPNNIGHRDWPGCFRCHDGEHFSEEQEAIRLECNLCHSIPTVVRPGEIEPMLPLTTGIEPSSHFSTTWISRHHNEFDTSCANCHSVENPGGVTDTSFCSNSGCHGTDWRFAGFDAPTLRIEIGMEDGQETQEPTGASDEPGGPVTYQTLLPAFELHCSACHGESPTVGLRVTDYESLMAGSDNGPVVIPEQPDESRIFQILNEGHFGEFTPEQMNSLREWIENGAPEGESATSESSPATYETLQPILEGLCSGCHSGDAASAGLIIGNYDSVMAGSANGPVVVPGEPADSRIVEVLEEGHFAALTEDQMALLTDWIASGAPETASDIEAGAETEGDAETETEDTAGAEAATYEALQPVLEETCSGCHGGDSPTAGLLVTDYESLIAGSDNGPVVVPGEPTESLIVEVLEEGHFAALTDDQMTLLTDWIANGAPETASDSDDSLDDETASEDADVSEAEGSFWDTDSADETGTSGDSGSYWDE